MIFTTPILLHQEYEHKKRISHAKSIVVFLMHNIFNLVNVMTQHSMSACASEVIPAVLLHC
jgi:hypothetical protein